VLGRLFEQVYSVERIEVLSRRARASVRALAIENVHFKIFDGSYGWSEFAPYRAIVVTAAAIDVPSPLLDQLEEGGRLVLPIATSSEKADLEDQKLVRVVRTGSGVRREDHGPCRFVPLVGKFGWES
jgi:protein-L-isoaspartate(D-aspartate) O-methyltransferase